MKTRGVLLAAALVLLCNARCGAEEDFMKYNVPPGPGETVSVQELKQEIDSGTPPVVFDARNVRGYQVGHIAGAKLPLSMEYYQRVQLYQNQQAPEGPDTQAWLERELKAMPREWKVVTYCGNNCNASGVLMRRLQVLGFKDVHAMKPGFEAWQAAGMPVEKE